MLAETGAVAIETIRASGYVWSWDEETEDVAIKLVAETYVNETAELVHVTVKGERLQLHRGSPSIRRSKAGQKPANSARGISLSLSMASMW